MFLYIIYHRDARVLRGWTERNNNNIILCNTNEKRRRESGRSSRRKTRLRRAHGKRRHSGLVFPGRGGREKKNYAIRKFIIAKP